MEPIDEDLERSVFSELRLSSATEAKPFSDQKIIFPKS